MSRLWEGQRKEMTVDQIESALKATVYQTQGTRPRQEDRYLCDERGIFFVADGMGGHDNGGAAAQAAVDALSEWGRLEWDYPDDRQLGLMRMAIQVADTKVCQVEWTGEKSKPGTTLTGLWLIGDKVVLGHVGDSRCYALTKAGDLIQQSQDHTAWDGLTQALGLEMDDPQVVLLAPQPVWLLCSDGLTGALTDAEIASLLRVGADAEALVDAALAKKRERQDNITAIVVRT